MSKQEIINNLYEYINELVKYCNPIWKQDARHELYLFALTEHEKPRVNNHPLMSHLRADLFRHLEKFEEREIRGGQAGPYTKEDSNIVYVCQRCGDIDEKKRKRGECLSCKKRNAMKPQIDRRRWLADQRDYNYNTTQLGNKILINNHL